LISALSDWDKAHCAADALGSMRERAREAVPALVKALKIPDFSVTASPESSIVTDRIIRALGDIGDPVAIPTLLHCLRNDGPYVRHLAAVALGKFRESKTIVPALEAALNDPEGFVRVSVAAALGQHGHPMAIPVLIGHLRAQYANEREIAAEGLGAMGAAANCAVSELEKAAPYAGGTESSIMRALIRIGTTEAKQCFERLQKHRVDSGDPPYVVTIPEPEEMSASMFLHYLE
jgi:HEAT repeat protein